jgi:hypothetical protein
MIGLYWKGFIFLVVVPYQWEKPLYSVSGCLHAWGNYTTKGKICQINFSLAHFIPGRVYLVFTKEGGELVFSMVNPQPSPSLKQEKSASPGIMIFPRQSSQNARTAPPGSHAPASDRRQGREDKPPLCPISALYPRTARKSLFFNRQIIVSGHFIIGRFVILKYRTYDQRSYCYWILVTVQVRTVANFTMVPVNVFFGT